MTVHDLSVAPHRSDAHLAQEIRTHHQAMVAELDRLTTALLKASRGSQAPAYRALDDWFEHVLVPHANEEEATTYRAAAQLAEARLLIDAMEREHVMIKRLVGLFAANDGPLAAAYGRAVFEAFDSHQRKENELILPLLVDAPDISLAQVVGGDHQHQTGGHAHH